MIKIRIDKLAVYSQVVALMGAHSLGGAKAENSGYRGKWTGPSVAGFSEIYYSTMLASNITWKNVVSSDSFSL